MMNMDPKESENSRRQAGVQKGGVKVGRRRRPAAEAVERSRTTRDTVTALQSILGSFGPISTFTRMSVGRLKAISEGTNKKPLTAAEVQKVAYLAKHAPTFLEGGSYGFHKVKGTATSLTYQQLSALSRHEFVPKEKMSVLDVALYFNPDSVESKGKVYTGVEWVQRLSNSRGITSAYLEAGGVVSAYGDDGQRYVAYIVTNQQTGESRFFWGRWDAVAEVAVMDFRDMYSLTDSDGYDVLIGG